MSINWDYEQLAARGSTTIASTAPTLVPQARAGRLSPAISTCSAMPSLVEDESSYSPDYLSADPDYDNSQRADALSDSAAARKQWWLSLEVQWGITKLRLSNEL